MERGMVRVIQVSCIVCSHQHNKFALIITNTTLHRSTTFAVIRPERYVKHNTWPQLSTLHNFIICVRQLCGLLKCG